MSISTETYEKLQFLHRKVEILVFWLDLSLKGIGGGSEPKFWSCVNLIELFMLISELFTKCKNSKYFSSNPTKREHLFVIFDSFWAPKWPFLGYFLVKKAKFLHGCPWKLPKTKYIHPIQEVWTIWNVKIVKNSYFGANFLQKGPYLKTFKNQTCSTVFAWIGWNFVWGVVTGENFNLSEGIFDILSFRPFFAPL